MDDRLDKVICVLFLLVILTALIALVPFAFFIAVSIVVGVAANLPPEPSPQPRMKRLPWSNWNEPMM